MCKAQPFRLRCYHSAVMAAQAVSCFGMAKDQLRLVPALVFLWRIGLCRVQGMRQISGAQAGDGTAFAPRRGRKDA